LAPKNKNGFHLGFSEISRDLVRPLFGGEIAGKTSAISWIKKIAFPNKINPQSIQVKG